MNAISIYFYFGLFLKSFPPANLASSDFEKNTGFGIQTWALAMRSVGNPIHLGTLNVSIGSLEHLLALLPRLHFRI
jgi:hypothetical protein